MKDQPAAGRWIVLLTDPNGEPGRVEVRVLARDEDVPARCRYKPGRRIDRAVTFSSRVEAETAGREFASKHGGWLPTATPLESAGIPDLPGCVAEEEVEPWASS